MLSMSHIETIRQLYQSGKSKSEISRVLNISRPTIIKAINKEIVNDEVINHVKKVKPSKLDKYKEIINSYLKDEANWFHKQRFTSKRLLEVLINEHNAEELKTSYSLLSKYVRHIRKVLDVEKSKSKGTLKLVWNPGEAQCDFGCADYYDKDGKLVQKGNYLILSFPYC